MKKAIWATTILLAALLPLSAEADWVYIGKYGEHGAISSGFQVDTLPKVGDTIRANQGIHLRDAPPHVKQGKWQFGKAISIIHIGQHFAIEELARSRTGAAPGDVWARGTVHR